MSLEPSSPPEPPPTPKLRTYKMKRGDTLIGIAGHFGTSVKKLIALNKVKDPSRIAIGTVLKIPPDATGHHASTVRSRPGQEHRQASLFAAAKSENWHPNSPAAATSLLAGASRPA